MVRVSVAAEKAGIPAVSIVATPFLTQAGAIAKGLGNADPAIAEYPGVPMIDTNDELRRKVVEQLLPRILKGWGQRAPQKTAPAPAEPAPRDSVFKGTLLDVNEFFYKNLWSDGLPVIPPTIPRVEAFLKFTDRAPDEVIGVGLPEYREATVWNIAVNGLMAGCRPEYMPLLIAIVEAIMDPVFSLEDGGATPGWEPLVIVNGSIVKDLDFNYGSGVMRVGRQANTSIGRFLRLYMRNIAGQRIPPGTSDKGSIGVTFNVALAENEDAVEELGWKSFGMDQGFKRGENVVTVQSVVTVTSHAYTAGKDARNHVQIISEVIGQTFAYWSCTGMRNNAWYPLIVMSPSVAKAITDDGWTKDDIRQYLYDHTKVEAGLVEKYAQNAAHNNYSLKNLVERGVMPPKYHESDDPHRLVPVFVRPEWIGIVLAGDPGRNQSKGYVQNHKHGRPVSKRVRLPADWRQLLKRAQQ